MDVRLPGLAVAILVVASLTAPRVHGQAPLAECSYDVLDGPEFEFISDDPSAPAKWIENFSPHKDFSAVIEPNRLRGLQGKIIAPATGLAWGRASVVTTSNCETIYVKKDVRKLVPSDAVALGVHFIDEHPTIWHLSESTDRMTDAKSCQVMAGFDWGTPNPLFFYHSREGFSVGLVGADFPGRERVFRVDKNPAISRTDELSDTQEQRLVDQIRAGGETLVVSGYEWPYDYPKVNELPLAGLPALLDRCRNSVR